MSSSKKKTVKKKIPKGSIEHKIERRKYLSQLVHEFNNTNSTQAKLQVLANLANFGYDPYNHGIFQELKVVDIFLCQVESSKIDKLIEFAMGGLCSCSFDDNLRQEIINGQGVGLIQQKLLSSTSSISVQTSALTILMSLVTPSTRQEILTQDLETKLYALVEHEDKRVVNLATIFLQDYFPIKTIPPPAKKRKIS